ncbi:MULTISPECIES: hypothetical protein [unclassified Fusibacter]|uniref:hypothetical protein n=1 Tax=unclassified Fusibacter TaxID=2624464 RepID=UPI0010103DD3|nr:MULTISPECIES: hypothetical protein [unclassified Fusibacter]MCK8060420.1 hypothetical protein [Fusibacter sp. A2]NPE20291.1 hypothetical protein [Fusibacter sp. A1]RXV63497.1 hypothetical protein DWB64_00565 [Fusibacter sp. A1]
MDIVIIVGASILMPLLFETLCEKNMILYLKSALIMLLASMILYPFFDLSFNVQLLSFSIASIYRLKNPLWVSKALMILSTAATAEMILLSAIAIFSNVPELIQMPFYFFIFSPIFILLEIHFKLLGKWHDHYTTSALQFTFFIFPLHILLLLYVVPLSNIVIASLSLVIWFTDMVIIATALSIDLRIRYYISRQHQVFSKLNPQLLEVIQSESEVLQRIDHAINQQYDTPPPANLVHEYLSQNILKHLSNNDYMNVVSYGLLNQYDNLKLHLDFPDDFSDFDLFAAFVALISDIFAEVSDSSRLTMSWNYKESPYFVVTIDNNILPTADLSRLFSSSLTVFKSRHLNQQLIRVFTLQNVTRKLGFIVDISDTDKVYLTFKREVRS